MSTLLNTVTPIRLFNVHNKLGRAHRPPPSPPPPAAVSISFSRRRRRLTVRATETDTNEAMKPQAPDKALSKDGSSINQLLGIKGAAQETEQRNKKYYFVVANAKFMLDEEEHFQELMSERLRNYEERNKEQDFWLVIEPKFLDKFPNITRRLKRPAVALVSTNGPWITFMKLRLDRVLSESYEADSLEDALASGRMELEFEKPENWVAPYPKYEYGWWEAFLPPGCQKSLV
ncbi:hypothetical protein Dimus_012864 [Dionaea muscipula]